MDFNAVLSKIGDWGRYQRRLCFLLILPTTALYVLVLYTQLFMLLAPPHRCSGLDNATDVCHRLELGGDNLTTELPCDSWEYDYSAVLPTVTSENDWVCDKQRYPYWIQTVFYLGFTVGAAVFGHVADRWGRRPAILYSYTLCSLAGFFSAFVKPLVGFAALRFVVGACCSPIVETSYILALEYIGKSRRIFPLVASAVGFAVFPALYPQLARLLNDWRLLCILSSVPVVPFLLLYRFVPESACWLAATGARERAVAQLRVVARVNGNDLPEELDVLPLAQTTDEAENNNEVRYVSLWSVFKTPRLRTQTLLLAFVWFVTTGSYHAAIQNSPNLGADVYESFSLGGLVEMPSVAFLLVAVDRLGRRWSLVISAALCGASGLLAPCLPPIPGYLVIGLLQRLAITTQYSVLAQYTTEVYPTVVRSRALALLNLVGTAAICLSPLLAYQALRRPVLPLVLSGVLALLVAFVALFLPETLNRHLPHTLTEGEQFGRDHRILDCPCIHGTPNDEASPKIL